MGAFPLRGKGMTCMCLRTGRRWLEGGSNSSNSFYSWCDYHDHQLCSCHEFFLGVEKVDAFLLMPRLVWPLALALALPPRRFMGEEEALVQAAAAGLASNSAQTASASRSVAELDAMASSSASPRWSSVRPRRSV